MSKNGFVHIIPLLIIAFVTTSLFSALSVSQENIQKKAVGKVLSSSDSGDGGNSGSGSSGSDENDGDEDMDDDDDKSTTSNTSESSGPGSNGTTRVESRTTTEKTKIETNKQKTKVEIRNGIGRFETEQEDGKEETKLRIGGLRIEYKKEGDEVRFKVKNENGEDVELEEDEEDELIDELEQELEDDDLKFATNSAQLGFVQNGKRVRTNFPLSVNPATGELFVTTPNGEKVVTILPDVAIQNMIAAGVLTRVVEEPIPSPSPAPGEATQATSVDGAGIELTTQEDLPVFVISGIKSQRFLGLVPVDLKLKATVSAQDGSLVDLQQGLFSRFLDLLSF